MHTRLIKETRDLLPVVAGAVLLTVLPYVMWRNAAANYGPVIFALPCVILAGVSFGGELQHRTLPLLLSQPVSRSLIWLEKMLVLGAALAVCTGVAWTGFGLIRWWPLPNPGIWYCRYLALISLCAWCGTPWFTLVTRSGIAGVVFGLAAPAGLTGLSVLAADRWLHYEMLGTEGLYLKWLVSGLLLIYCAVTLALGYFKFRQLEITDGESADMVLPEAVEAALAGALGRIASKFSRPVGSLAGKELRLQQASFFIMAVFCLLAVIGAGLYLVRPEWGEMVMGGDFAVYVLLIPLVVGALAVAEERALRIADWHFTLPPSAWRQWFVKIRVAFSTSLILGLVLPALLVFCGRAVLWLYGLWLHGVGQHGAPAQTPGWGIFVELAVLSVLWQACVTSIAVYTGSFSTSVLRAILAGCLIIPIAVGWIWLVPGLAYAISNAGLSGFVGVVLALVLLGFTQWFAWRNFCQRNPPTRAVVGQLVRLGCYGIGFVFVLVCLVLLFKSPIVSVLAR